MSMPSQCLALFLLHQSGRRGLQRALTFRLRLSDHRRQVAYPRQVQRVHQTHPRSRLHQRGRLFLLQLCRCISCSRRISGRRPSAQSRRQPQRQPRERHGRDAGKKTPSDPLARKAVCGVRCRPPTRLSSGLTRSRWVCSCRHLRLGTQLPHWCRAVASAIGPRPASSGPCRGGQRTTRDATGSCLQIAFSFGWSQQLDRS